MPSPSQPRLKLTSELRELLRRALAEDVGRGDATTQSIFSERTPGGAAILARESGVLCGLPVVRAVARLTDPQLQVRTILPDGARLRPGDWVLTLRGDVRAILTAERVSLNFLQRLSGIATLTRSYVDQLGGGRSRIYDTRKTTPLWRTLERYAVRVGGGVNHRFGLDDAILIKNNHADYAGGLAEALRRCHQRRPRRLKVIVEARDLDEVRAVAAAGADVILLDNMTPRQVRQALALLPSTIAVEVSGGITPRRLRALAALGVPRISVGALTHSAPALDFSLRVKAPAELKEIAAREPRR